MLKECKINIKLLGTPGIFVDGQAIMLKRKKSRAIVYYLATRRNPVSREELVEILWPQFERTTALKNLSTYVHNIRCTIPDMIKADKNHLTLAPHVEIDAKQLDEYCIYQKYDEESARMVDKLYRGAFLKHFHVDDSDEFEQWKDSQAEYYLNQVIKYKYAVAGQLMNRAKYQEAIIGGGPAGLEAARVARLRGHDVTIVEKAGKLGGQLNIAAISMAKQSLTVITKYLVTQINKLGVKVELNTEATPEFIAERKPDAVIIATGAQPLIPKSIPGIDKEHVMTAWDVLSSEKRPGENVVVIGGGAIGCEVAEYLAGRFTRPYTKGRTEVSIVEMQDCLAAGLDTGTMQHHADYVGELGIDVHLNSKVKEITDDGVIIEKNGKELVISGKDTVILAMGAKPYNPLEGKLEGIVPEVYVIGDANVAQTAMEATHAGADIGRRI